MKFFAGMWVGAAIVIEAWFVASLPNKVLDGLPIVAQVACYGFSALLVFSICVAAFVAAS